MYQYLSNMGAISRSFAGFTQCLTLAGTLQLYNSCLLWESLIFETDYYSETSIKRTPLGPSQESA